MRPCTICTHPKRGEIETALVDERPFRAIAEHFGVSYLAVYRHYANHPLIAQTLASHRRFGDDPVSDSDEAFRWFERAKTRSFSEALRAAACVERTLRRRLKVIRNDSAAEPVSPRSRGGPAPKSLSTRSPARPASPHRVISTLGSSSKLVDGQTADPSVPSCKL